MKILFVSQIIPYPPHGGVLQRSYNLLRELGREHDVHLLAFHHPDELPPGTALTESLDELGRFCSDVEYFRLWPKQSRAHAVTALAAGLIYPFPFSVLAHSNRRLGARIRALCKTLPPDIVHLDTIGLAPYLRDCASVPTVLGHHNIESVLMRRRAQYESGFAARLYVREQARRLRNYERSQADRFRLNVTVSEADATMLRKICPGARTAVIPNGVDTGYFSPRPGEETSALVYTGGMNMFANRDAIDWFLDAVWPAIKADAPETQFFAIGQNPSNRLLQAAAADSSIHAPGFVEDVRPWVARAAVYVVPLRVGGGTRLKVVDAMAQGKAIVSTSLGAEGIDAVDGEHLILADEPDDFASRVVRLLRDETEMHRLGRAARQRAEERYAWPILGERLARLYANAIDG